MTTTPDAIASIKSSQTATTDAVDPSPASRPTISIQATPLRNGIRSDGGTVDLLVEVFADASQGRTQSSPLNLAFVIDRSGSMSGKPLDQAKACVAAMIRRLKPTDRAAVVLYDNTVQVPIKSAPVVEILPVLDQRLAGIHSGGMTALHAGWLAGAEETARSASATALSRIILLSDGNANEGITDSAEIARQCGVMADSAVSTSTYGLGQGFNEQLMTEMAAKGNGYAYYGETHNDLMPKFETEFDALSATIGRDPSLSVMPAGECLNDYRRHQDGGSLIPNLVEGAASWAMYRLTLPAGAPATAHVVSLSVSYLAGDGARENAEYHLEIPVVTDPAALPEDGKVASRLRELEAARIQTGAKTAADAGDWKSVETSIAELRQIADGNDYILGVADTLQGLAKLRQTSLFSKEALFAANAMTRSYTGLSDASLDIGSMAAPSYARRQARQGTSNDGKGDEGGGNHQGD